MATKEAIEKACKRLGYQNLRSVQEEVVLNFLEGRDIFVSLPTGHGKSPSACASSQNVVLAPADVWLCSNRLSLTSGTPAEHDLQ